MTQPSLAFDRQPKAPKVNEAQVALVVCILTQMHAWVQAKGFAPTFSDRQLRAIAEASEGRIISGQQGYKALSCATSAEINHCIAALKSQGEKMIARSKAIEIARHRCQEGAA